MTKLFLPRSTLDLLLLELVVRSGLSKSGTEGEELKVVEK